MNVKLSERSWEASHGVCSSDGAASGVQPGSCVHNRWKPLLPATQWISSKLSWYTYTPPYRTHSPGNLTFYLIFSFQQQVIQIRLHSVRRIYKRRHGLRPLVSTTGTESMWIMILPFVGHRFNPGVRVSMPPPPGSRGVLYWEWFLLRHLPEVLQHSRQRRGLLLHRHFPRWGGRPLLTVIKIKPKTFMRNLIWNTLNNSTSKVLEYLLKVWDYTHFQEHGKPFVTSQRVYLKSFVF